jgi:sugar phosphate isomerase/epimerase
MIDNRNLYNKAIWKGVNDMQMSCLPVSLFPELMSGELSLADWLIAARGMGLDGADISVLFLRQKAPFALAETKMQIRGAGLPILMMTAYPDLTQPDGAARERELACAVADIAAAAELEIPYFRITAGQYYEGQDDLETAKRVAESLSECCKWAARWGVRLLLENHAKPGAWQRPDFVFDTNRFRLLCDLTRGMEIGINFDTANTHALGDDSVALFREVFPRVQSLHVNDICGPDGGNGICAPLDGNGVH